ncbi:MAG: cob(I)yrinic acid a,c-diamide adenosyltransferase [Deltaproteobacteria bacterium]|nr:cob(I)yrinic acid a,c-diamide adenosyltransferase [Deltaproteobacteria bacterium]
MKIYTRRGDGGETDLFGGQRVPKDALRVEAYGSVDELCAAIGVAASSSSQADVLALVAQIQSELFILGSALATPDAAHRAKAGIPEPDAAEVEAMERAIDGFSSELPALARFILPGGTTAAAGFQLARAVCRRAERCVVALRREEPVAENAVRYLNRLSDLLFVLARIENRRAGITEPEWVLRPR